MGTPEFAVASLDRLLKSDHKILAVVTAPDNHASRGLKIQQSAVKKYALKNNLSVLQPERLKDENFINTLKELNPDIIVVVAFRMLPKVIWKFPKFGTINLHASLLPQYRGAAPINWSIINGEEETGVTTFFINEDIDKGDILLQEKISIYEKDNAGDIHDELMVIGSELLLKTIDGIGSQTLESKSQESTKSLKMAPKIFRENCHINWRNNAIDIHNLIRGLSPLRGDIDLKCKEILITNDAFYIGCEDDTIEILELQLEGRKIMSVRDFLRGFKLDEWNVI